jgi:hypothetical protein
VTTTLLPKVLSDSLQSEHDADTKGRCGLLSWKDFVQMTQYAQATDAFQEAAKFRPNNEFILQDSGLSRYVAGDPDGMKLHLEQLERIVPKLHLKGPSEA